MIDLYIAKVNAWLALRCWAIMQSVATRAYSIYQRIEDKAFDQQNEWHECEDDLATAAHILAQSTVDKALAKSAEATRKALQALAAANAAQAAYPEVFKRYRGY